MSSSSADNILEVFFSYSHKDETLCDELNAHLAALKRQSVIKNWTDRRITAGDEWRAEIEKHLDSADLILLLISADFLNSDFCYLIETSRALLRHESGDTRVIPVIVRPVDWQDLPIGKIQAMPKDGKPVTLWPNRDEAWLNVAQGIRKAIEEMAGRKAQLIRESDLPPTAIPRPPHVGFVARRDQNGRDLIERLCEELAPERPQIVTLWGPGGAGKTTLAAEAARAMADQFRGRIVWTGPQMRADFTDSALLDEVATQLGRANLRTAPPPDKPDLVRALLAESPALVVLDNFETIPSESQSQCVKWLTGAPCPVLITTRDKIDHTRSVPIAAMSVEEAQDFLSRLIEEAHDRASFDGLDRGIIIDTAERNPLVMQWIVAQIDEAQRPRDVLAELRQGEGDAARRVFDRSFNLEQLGNDGRAALLALSLFTPSASREALAEVAGFGGNLKRLNEAVRRLARLWLIVVKDGGERLAIEGLTREMARARINRLPNGEEFKNRFVTYFLTYTESHDQPNPEDYGALEAERENLLGAMDIAFETQDWRTVTRLMDAAFSSGQRLHARGYWDEAKERGEQALTAARKLQDERSIAGYAHNLAVIYQNQGDLDKARSLLQQSLDIARKLGDQLGIANTLGQLGMLAHNQGDLDEARSLYQQSLDINRKLGDQSRIASMLHQFGLLTQHQGNFDEARSLYQQSLDINRKIDSQSGIASTLHNLAIISQDQGDLDEARTLYRQSLDIKRKLGDQIGIASALHQLGLLAQDQGDLDEARSLCQQSLDINCKLGNQSGIAISIHQLGLLAQARGDLDEARSLCQQSLEIARKLGNQSGIALTLGQLGRIAEDEEDKVEAARLFREALTIFERLRSPYAEIVRKDLERVKARDEG
jgi:tetratricopeptide (TPR) repeat protein